MTTSNVNEADIIESILNMEQIPVHREEIELGNYLKIYHGYSMYGIDLYVPVNTIKCAKDIVRSEYRDENLNIHGNPLEEQDIEYRSNRQNVGRIIVWVMLITNLASLVIFIIVILWEFIKAIWMIPLVVSYLALLGKRDSPPIV